MRKQRQQFLLTNSSGKLQIRRETTKSHIDVRASSLVYELEDLNELALASLVCYRLTMHLDPLVAPK